MTNSWKSQVLPLAAIFLSFLVTALLLPQLPTSVPIHWGPSGQPDNYAPRIWGAFLLPLTSLGVYLLFLVLPSLDPKRANYSKFADTYHFLRVAFVLFMVFLQGVTLYSILFADDQMNNNLVFIGVGLLFVIIGNYMPRVRSNWFVGFRNPWTLSNQVVWRRTHRLGGMVFVFGGLVVMLVGFLPNGMQLGVLIAAIAGMTLIPAAYSFWLFRSLREEK
jgi:uncharacterized membrane protein